MDINKNLEKLNKIGIALSAEKNLHKLLEMIVDEAMDITNADAGTLYLMIDNKIVFTRIFPQGINMRVLKGAQYDILGNVDLAVRFVVEFKDSRYRVLIDRLGYFDNE